MVTLAGQLVVDGLAMGMIYVILAAGLVFIMSVTRIFYIAYGQFYMMGAFICWAGVELLNLPYIIGLLMGVGFAAGLGLFSYRAIFQYTTYAENPFLTTIVAAIGLMMILSQVGLVGWGPSPRSIPTVFPGIITIADINISADKLALIVIGVTVTVLLFMFYARTKMGRAMRAVSFSTEAASLQGINSKGICFASVGIGAALAGFAGGIIAPAYSLIPEMGNNIILNVIIIAMLGGIDSLLGAVFAGLVVGQILSFGQYFIGGAYVQVILFISIGVIVSFRPGGLLGSRQLEL